MAHELGHNFGLPHVAEGGTVMSVAPNRHFVTSLYVGRGVSGIATGALSVLVPLYQSEVAPCAIRGKLMATFQLAITLGIMAAYMCAFILEDLSVDSSVAEADWRLALLLQVVPALVLAVGTLLLPHY